MPTSAPDPVVAPRSARPARLHRTQDYARVQGAARRVHGAILLALVSRGASPVSRVGLTVSRKVGGAVVRNRVKRWLREAVRAVGTPPGGPWDVVLVARADAANAGYTAVEAQVRHLFHRELPARMGRAGSAVP